MQTKTFTNYLCFINSKRGDQEKGLNSLRLALSFDDENPDALTSLATCYIETGNYTGAEALLKIVLDKNPDFLEARVSYGGLFSKLGILGDHFSTIPSGDLRNQGVIYSFVNGFTFSYVEVLTIILYLKRGYLFFSVKDRNLFHRVDTIGNIFTSGCATRENITIGVHEIK